MRCRWLSALVIAGLVSMSSATLAQTDFKLGTINPLSGPMAPFGGESNRGFELAADWINARGGLLGRRVRIVAGSAGTPQEGIAAAEQLISSDRVDALLGTYASSIANAASEAALAHEKLYFESMALATELTSRDLPNFVRSGPNSDQFANRSVEAVVKLIAPGIGKPLQATRVWIEHEDTIYGTSIAAAQVKGLKAAGVQVVGVGAHSARAIDMSDAILRAKAATPDIWLQAGYVVDTNLLLRTAKSQGFVPRAILTVGTGDTSETLQALGKEDLEGMLVVSYPRYDSPERYAPGIRAYSDAYVAKYGRRPELSQSLIAFTGARILFDLAAKAGSLDAAAIRKAAAAFDMPPSTYESGFGAKFTADGQNLRADTVVAQWQDGRMVTVFPQAAASGSLSGAQFKQP